MAKITNPVSFSIFNRANRQPGSYVSTTAQVPEGVYALGMTDTLTDAVASAPANRYRLVVKVSQDGSDWTGPLSRSLFIYDWAGGTHVDKRTGQTVPNHMSLSWSDSRLAAGAYVGWFARAEIELAVQMQVGFDCVVYPPGFDPA
jgi:hypothetical protein